ncbi:TIM barrel protein [Corynebacterium heidelbergense]|uniref:Endonuclease n=1 Tax=Corynebacterium heidelbergense TaxID=2055947 RepID=A0A364VB23_9CORY|nr:TIM barrel protein [Corynebacterium heidelbergense]RAV33837.1 endonuclease [Corynebacterium heidelbergense]WCZ36831.1 Hydroxypyruvate isomerase [Corynebacterium heidelbergense]
MTPDSPAPDSPTWITGRNRSIGAPAGDWRSHLSAAQGPETIELWWPFPTPVAPPAEIQALVRTVRQQQLRLTAINLWGGDMTAGDRGILHRADLPRTHLESILRIHEATGADKFNLQLGRGGSDVLPSQVDRVRSIGEFLGNRVGGVVLIEPLSAMSDYPIRTIDRAWDLIGAAGTGGLLMDLYHLRANGEIGAELTAEDLRRGLPTHVQVADHPGRGEPGSGTAPLQHWVRQLRQAGYAGEVMGEWLPRPVT